MAKYEITTASGRYEIDSPTELSEAELDEAASGLEDGEEPAEAPQGFAGRVGRRVSEAGEAALDIPSSAMGLVTGGDRGRLAAGLRLLQGVASPISMLTAIPEAATEQAATSVLPENWARLAGDVGGLVSTLGLGLASKAGKLGPYAERLAKVIGVGRPAGLPGQLASDPQLRFAISRLPTNETADEARALEILTRLPEAPLEELALAAKSPRLAQAQLENRALKADKWLEWAKQGQLIDEVPAPVSLSPSEALAFAPDAKRDMTILGNLGTPTNVAARINPKGAQAAYEMAVTEAKMNQAIRARSQRNDQALLGVGDEELARAVRIREGLDSVDLADPKYATQRRVNDFLEQKFEVDRQIIIPRLRNSYRARVEGVVRKELEDTASQWGEKADPALLKQRTEAKLREQIPDDWGLEQYIPHIFPGSYKVKDSAGRVLGSAETKLEAKYLIRDLALDGIDVKDLKVDSQTFFEPELLGLFKSRVQRSAESIAKAAVLSDEEIAAAGRGDIAFSKKYKFFGNLGERVGKNSGYTKDLQTILQVYDRGIERWMQLSDMAERVVPVVRELGASGYPGLARMLENTMKSLWGYRHPLSQYIDNTLAAIPLVNQMTAPFAMERWATGIKSGLVNVMLRFNPRYHAINSTQIAQTLWPVADASEISQGFKLRSSEQGKALLSRHGIDVGTKVAAMSKNLGRAERMNQEVAFLTMYNRARKLGLEDQRAADYALLRGNLYTQFLGLASDQPHAFQKLDPSGLLFMFQRFPIKQYEQLLDVVKDRNFPAAAKWLTTNLALGGFRAATMGQGGWLTYKLYKDIEKEYGKPTADLFHVGLPGLLGVDLSNSVMLFNPPFGDNWAEKIGNIAEGPLGSIVSSVIGAAANSAGPEPNAAKRAFDALVQRLPLAKELDAVRRLFEEDYEFKDPIGRLRYKGDVKDVVKRMLGARTLTDADLDTFAGSLLDVRQQRDQVLNFVASRYGQARLAGVDLGEPMMQMIRGEVDKWNTQWPEFPISGTEIQQRATRRQQTAMQSLRERLLRGSPRVLRQSETFGGSIGDEASQPYEGDLPKIPFGGG